jgi:hypothetical protein
VISHTKQEWFDLAVRGLAGQRWRQALDVDGACTYGQPGGDRCAIGHGLGEVANLNGVAMTLVTSGRIGVTGTCSSDFLTAMQFAHDLGLSPRKMRKAFVRLAKRYDLTWPADVPKEGAIQ